MDGSGDMRKCLSLCTQYLTEKNKKVRKKPAVAVLKGMFMYRFLVIIFKIKRYVTF